MQKNRKYVTKLMLFFALAFPMAHTVAKTTPVAETTGTSFAARLQDFAMRTAQITEEAMSMLGIRYRMGGNSPESGLDCSGLVRYVFKQAWNKELPRTAAEQSKVGQKIGLNELQPGDLVFYNTRKKAYSHVGIYIGDNKFIHSPSAGSEVRIENLDVSYWQKRFNGARRIDSEGIGHGGLLDVKGDAPTFDYKNFDYKNFAY